MSTIKRKYCKLHGWVTFSDRRYDTLVQGWTLWKWECTSCKPPEELTTGQKIRKQMRGFKLHKSMRAKDFMKRFTKEAL